MAHETHTVKVRVRAHETTEERTVMCHTNMNIVKGDWTQVEKMG